MSTIFNKNKIQKTIESLKKTLNTQKTIKSPNATSIAQGTIEYLVIIAVVIVIALVVVALILNMTDYDQVQIMSNKNQNLIGKGGISIIDSAINSSGEGVILFQNTLGESLTIKSITPGAESSCEKVISSGTKYSCYLTNIDSVCPCNPKERVTCDFKINFVTKEGIQKSETFTIINDCTDQSITSPDSSLSINLISPSAGYVVTSPDNNTNFVFRANRTTTDCNLYIRTSSWNFAERRTQTTPKNTTITIDANVAFFGTNVNSWKIKCADEENNTGESIDRSITYSPETPPTTYTVTFDSQGGSSIDPISGIQSGATITLPTNPTKTGYTFVEWNTQANGLGTEFTASTQVTQNIIIYAQWEEEQTPAFFESCWRETAPHTICNCFDLNKMRENNEWNYILQKDINMNATECAIFQTGPGFEPMGWMGQFDGNNKKIIGLYINRPTMDYVGLAGAFLSVKNLTMEEVDITGRNYVGGIAGFSTDMNNCSTSGTVTGQNSVGGLIGRNEEYRSVTFTHSNATIIGVNNVGGIIGKSSNDNPIKNSYFSGTINATGDKVGGIVGEIWGHNDDRNMINNCYFNGTITGVNHVGGLVGYLFYADVSNSYTLGNIEGQVNVGGISGITWASSIIDSNSSSTIIGQENVGGITGRQDGTYDNDPSGISHLIRCNSSGNITAGAYMVGGLVGNMYGDINESYSTATITGDGACGGLAGGNFENNYPEGVIEISINNSYYISNSINCNATSGGLVGFYENEIPLIKNSYSSTNITGTDNWSIIPDEYGDASITNSYYDSTKFSGEYTNGTGLTTSQMKQSTNFSGWDFSTIWNITNGTTYPYLRNNTQSPLPQ